MEQNLDKIKQTYDSVSKEYAVEFTGEHEKKTMDQEILKRFAQEVKDSKPVWDLGCGPGQTTKYLKNLGIEISGLDLSELSIQQARNKNRDIHFQQGNMLELVFENNSIAAIVSFYAIVHFTKDQVRKAFNEIYRVLKRGGLFLFTFHIGNETIHLDEFLGKSIDVDFMFFTTEFIADCLQQCGFKQIEIIEREPYPEVEYQSQRAYIFATKPLD